MLSLGTNREVIRRNGPIVIGPEPAMAMNIAPGLAERRIYLYLEVIQAAQADFTFFSVVRALKGLTPVAEFEAQLCDFRAGNIVLPRSMGSCFSSGGSPVGDCYNHLLTQPFNPLVTSVVLQPLRVNFNADLLEFHIIAMSGQIQGYRAFLRCLSTQY
jgi:hypothetical protein